MKRWLALRLYDMGCWLEVVSKKMQGCGCTDIAFIRWRHRIERSALLDAFNKTKGK